MKICILTPRYPFPENGGDVLRINGIAKYLKAKGHKLILVSYINQQNTVNDTDKLIYDEIVTVKFNRITSIIYSFIFFLFGKTIQCGYYYSIKYKKVLCKAIKKYKPDLYISHLVRMEPFIKKCGIEQKSIIEMTDALSKTYNLSSKTKSFSIKKFVYKLERKPITKIEQKIIKRYPKVVLVSESDITYLGNNKSLKYHTNGIDIYKNDSQYNKNKICFVGNMRTIQNQDAVLFFINNIFPLIKKTSSEAEFHIVGAEPPDNIKKIANGKDIFVTGFVDSVEKYIENACMLVAPVNIAAGIQNKVLIGMACKIPVILTSLIAQPIKGLKDGDNCFIEDDVEKFAEKCVILMNDTKLRETISIRGQQFVEQNYSWNKTLEGYENI